METSPFEITTDHVRIKFEELERRIGFAAAQAFVERNEIEQATIDSMNDAETARYVEMLRDPDASTSDQAEDEADAIELEIRQAFGSIEGYRLAEISARSIVLVHYFTDANYFRPSLRLSYDTISGQYEKILNLIPKGFTTQIREPQPVTEHDQTVVTQALKRIERINRELSDKRSD